MIRAAGLAAISILCTIGAAHAGAMEKALAKLAPQERSHQACALKGLDVVRLDRRLREADRMKSSILAPAQLTGSTLVAKGGAVRSGKHWYALSYTCKLTPDLMKGTSFEFALGPEIPKNKWDDLGLWE